MSDQSFQQFLNERLRERGLTLKRLSELSGVNLKYLEQLSNGSFEELPAAPYLRGYIVKISEILEFDHETWWKFIKREEGLKTSGGEDQLPKNRFARERTPRPFWIAALIVLAVLFFGVRASRILGRPTLTISNLTEETLTTSSDRFTIEGTITGGNKVVVNNESVDVGADGSWSKSVILEPGINLIEIKGRKFLGNEVTAIRRIVYEAPSAPTSTEPVPTVPQ